MRLPSDQHAHRGIGIEVPANTDANEFQKFCQSYLRTDSTILCYLTEQVLYTLIINIVLVNQMNIRKTVTHSSFHQVTCRVNSASLEKTTRFLRFCLTHGHLCNRFIGIEIFSGHGTGHFFHNEMNTSIPTVISGIFDAS